MSSEEEKPYTVKMRASLAGRHVSGAERIVSPRDIPRTLAALAERALRHERGTPDFINLKAETAEGIVRIGALPVATFETASAGEGWRKAEELLRAAGIVRAREICERFSETYSMRGAMILDADTLERIDGGGERGVRATNMDSDAPSRADRKNHFAEALVLASKVLSAPGIVAEVCMSDDPCYVTGYVASRANGYCRITKMKEPGDESGGRIFLYRGRREDLAATMEYLERKPVIVELGGGTAGEGRFASLERDLAEAEAAGLKRRIRTVDSRSGSRIRIGDREVVSFASNDYLGYAADRRVASAAAEAALRHGAGSGASRLVSGTLPPHVELERRLASFNGAQDALVFATGYMANAGTISAVAGKGDVVFSDELNHASIIDGCRLSGARVEIYPHLELDALDRMLANSRGFRRRLVVTDGVFSMDGDMVDLPRFLEICRRHDAFSMVDEAHSIGVAGKTGRGLCEHFGCGGADFSMGTLSKALGSSGAYVAGSAAAIDYLRQKARTFIFSTAPDVAAMAAASAALSLLEEEPEKVARLRANTELFVSTLAQVGIEVSTSSAIVPIPVGDERVATEVSKGLFEKGFYIPEIRYPTVARGAARLRVALSALHAEDEIRSAALAIADFLKTAR